MRYTLRNGKVSNARSFPSSSTPLCLQSTVFFHDQKMVKHLGLFWSLAKIALITLPWSSTLNSSFIRCAKTQVSLFLIITHRFASMWKQLAAADPSLKYAEDIELFAKYKDYRRFTQFMMVFVRTLNLLELLSSSFT